MKVLADKKLLILGGSFQHIKVVNSARKAGVIVYVTDYLNDSPAKKVADVSFNYDVRDTDRIIELCKQEKIDGVINVSLDPCQAPYQKICEQLNLPCFGTFEQFSYLTNKELFKKLCKQCHVDYVKSFSQDEIVEMRQNGVTVEFPLFVKPDDSRGSRGQSICKSWEEYDFALDSARRESSSGKVIIEQYMGDADDFTVAYLVSNGEPILVRTGDRIIGNSVEGLDHVAIASASPSIYTDSYIHDIDEDVKKMIHYLRIVNGPVFFQGLYREGKVYFYDPGLRFSGGEYEVLLEKATGIDIIDYLVEFSLTGEMSQFNHDRDLFRLNGKRVLQICPALMPGKIAEILGEEAIKEIDNVITFNRRYNQGDTVPECNDVRRRFAEICVLCNDALEERKVIDQIFSKISVLDKNGIEMLCGLLNPSRDMKYDRNNI